MLMCYTVIGTMELKKNNIFEIQKFVIKFVVGISINNY